MSVSTPDRAETSSSGDRSRKRIAIVTGATGFIGQHVCRTLLDRGWSVRGTVRHATRASALVAGVEPIVWDLSGTDAPTLPVGATAVIHLAGLAHQMGAAVDDVAVRYRRANVEATRRLLAAARDAGVRRFVYVSSVKVLGEGEGSPYASDARVDPRDAYATSKAEAEAVVREESGALQWTIVRPAFVYGAAGKGNVIRLAKLARIASRIPLPLGGIHNRRSVVYVENLADLLAFCAESDATTSQILPGVDRQSVSTPELLTAVASSLGVSAHLFSLPTPLLALLARATGRAADWARLAGSFEVDTTSLRRVGWTPPVPFDETFRRSARPMPQPTSAPERT